MDPTDDHAWPEDPAEHVYGPWMAKTAAGKPTPPTQYRTCIHPRCGASETREAPRA